MSLIDTKAKQSTTVYINRIPFWKVHQKLKDYEAWKKSSRQSVTLSHTMEMV